MSEWRGPWKCEKCGRMVANLENVRDDFHWTQPSEVGGGISCSGKFRPYERRAAAVDTELAQVRKERDEAKRWERLAVDKCNSDAEKLSEYLRRAEAELARLRAGNQLLQESLAKQERECVEKRDQLAASRAREAALREVAIEMDGLAITLRGEGSPDHSEDLRRLADRIRAALSAAPRDVRISEVRIAQIAAELSLWRMGRTDRGPKAEARFIADRLLAVVAGGKA